MFKITIEQLEGGKIYTKTTDCSAEDIFLEAVPAMLSLALEDMPVNCPKENAKHLSIMCKLLLNGLAEVFERRINEKTEKTEEQKNG